LNPAASLLRQGIAGLGLVLPEAACTQLDLYIKLLTKWNKVYNLTAIRGEQKFVSHHLLDSLAVVPFLPAGRLVDVGSGAGLPGIPIAVACPQHAVTLLDSNHKRGAFLRQVITELGLANVNVVVERVEMFRPTERFEAVISRAFSELADFIRMASHLCRPDGVLLAMKGGYPREEIGRLPEGWPLEEVIPLHVPQLDAERHLLVLRPMPVTE
jgi:16S rRNA (guanine527-N7)-methyltransferase